MNAITLAIDPGRPREPFSRATDRVNAWRGRCLESFSRAESAVTETLAALSQVNGRGVNVRLPHLIGQRFEALKEAIVTGGPFEAEGGAALPALEWFHSHADRRAALCHGVGQVTLDRRERWTLLLRVTTFRAKSLSYATIAMTKDEATQTLADIRQSSQRLCANLTTVRARIVTP
jgi:hypothetical protein